MLHIMNLPHLYLNLLFGLLVTNSGMRSKANASYQLTSQIPDIACPILAGLLIAVIGGFHTLWVTTASFAGIFFAVWFLPSMKSVSANTLTSICDIFVGMKQDLRYLVTDKLNLSLSLQAMVGNFGYTAAFAILLYYLLSVLRFNS